MSCFITYFNFGIRSGGGIGDVIGAVPYGSSWYWMRLVTDMVFYITVILLIMNMINGIIISTFSELREEDEKTREDQENKCFICSLEREKFENKKRNFERHRKIEHNYYTYIQYFITLRFIRDSKLNSNESYILKCLENKEVAFFPVKRSYYLGNTEDDEEESEEEEDANDQNPYDSD